MIGFMQGRLSPPISEKIQEFPWNTWEREFISAKKIGIKLMEWTLDHQDFTSNPFITDDGQIRIKQLSKEFDVSIESVTLDCFLDAPLHRTHPQSGEKSKVSDLVRVIESSVRLDVGIGVLPLVAESGVDDQKSLGLLMDLLAEIDDLCGQNDFRIALECEFELNILRWIAGQIGSFKNVGFNLDIGNSASLNNDLAKELEIYGKKLFNVHVKDRLVGGKTVPLGDGNADFQLVATELSRWKYNGNMILQAARQVPTYELATISNYMNFCKKYGWS